MKAIDEGDYLVEATGGSSTMNGHMDIVFTLPLLFLMTVIFMFESPEI
jgi:hypothetical protein